DQHRPLPHPPCGPGARRCRAVGRPRLPVRHRRFPQERLRRRAVALVPPGPAPRRRGGHRMKWVTRARPKTDRIACPWLIRRFVDPDAEFLYVPTETVLDVERDQGALGFDTPGARYDHRDGLCTFEVLIQDHHLTGDPALMR